jgi:hypothetical protein
VQGAGCRVQGAGCSTEGVAQRSTGAAWMPDKCSTSERSFHVVQMLYECSTRVKCSAVEYSICTVHWRCSTVAVHVQHRCETSAVRVKCSAVEHSNSISTVHWRCFTVAVIVQDDPR